MVDRSILKRRAMPVYFSPAATLAQITAHTSGERSSFLCRFLLISISTAYGFDILKKCDEVLKVTVDYMDVDNVSFEVEC